MATQHIPRPLHVPCRFVTFRMTPDCIRKRLEQLGISPDTLLHVMRTMNEAHPSDLIERAIEDFLHAHHAARTLN